MFQAICWTEESWHSYEATMTMLQRTLSWLVLSATAILPAIGGGQACAADAVGDDDAAAAAKTEELLKAMTLDE